MSIFLLYWVFSILLVEEREGERNDEGPDTKSCYKKIN